MSPMNRQRKNKSNVLNEKDERPGCIIKEKSSVRSMAKTQPTSGRTISLSEINKPIALSKKNTEIKAAVEIQNRLTKKMAKNSERRKKMAHGPEMTAQNRTQERIDFVEFLDRHYQVMQAGVSTVKVHKMHYTKEEFENVIYEAQTIFSSEKALVDIDPPCVVVGNLHGQFNDLINMFILLGRPPETVYVFTECVTSIPKCGEEIWALFQRCFNNLPISALIATKILCMHGGLSPALTCLDELRNHPKPIRNPFRGIVNDMLWADPDPSVFEWKTSSRGSGFTFGTNVIDDVCKRLGVELIIRAHQMCFDGYWVLSGRKLITIFSAPMYCNFYKNTGCVLKVDETLGIQTVAFVPESENIEKIIEEMNRVWDISIDCIE
uniref:Uncharacterized protein C30A5.4 n=1 Tax=Caenorhabditis elegans TaxID=6239 RepID=YK84_CAEEL|nr:RecName: Full=Uncharacterized protein C30A5.4 [Caenorhabditis elegans]|eukprot:NP_498797.1 Uncharacterized protein CELE_C30A5.4 [Caenorhabditis elegans]